MRNYCSDLVWCAARIGQIDNDEPGQVCKRADGFGQITASWFLEIKQHGRVVALAQLFSQGIQNRLPLGSESTQNQDNFGSDRVDDLTNFCIVQQQVDELGNLEIINSDRRFTVGCDNEAVLFGSFYL